MIMFLLIIRSTSFLSTESIFVSVNKSLFSVDTEAMIAFNIFFTAEGAGILKSGIVLGNSDLNC